jgi:hypothetical protein
LFGVQSMPFLCSRARLIRTRRVIKVLAADFVNALSDDAMLCTWSMGQLPPQSGMHLYPSMGRYIELEGLTRPLAIATPAGQE